MEDQIVSFETAQIAKEKGFDIPVPRYYMSNSKLFVNSHDSDENVI